MKTEHINFTEKALSTLPLPDKSDDVAFRHGLKTLHSHKMIAITRDDIARVHTTLRQMRGPATATKYNSENCIFLPHPAQEYSKRFEVLWNAYKK